ncbi:tRNA (adenosine(37)-N6)-threonylcarbamoyltransferase complex dimerization subunit type 1 TsaB [Longispora albida]|uniref:tRNA (adenosine(37)-N6)-threonylcarbamoyltransferase complex dimerization subunit type 1 TsaB n=1 Tax=Longispora albida TaxID=203523 RepID=UPI0003A9894A|nr:tRNA (adenosine(37)-N6)-threonylcarbamoyltransferase complex dimerization subunit type 1 TsaB [Longispora albida]
MLTLVIDTATPCVTAGLYDTADGKTVASRTVVNPRAHGESLSPFVAECLSEAGAAPRDLKAIVAGVGPGPYTGLRVGLVTAMAMGHALGIPTYGVCTLDGIAYGTRGRLLIATDARRKELYYGVYADGVRVSGPSVGRAADIEPDFEAAAGAGATLYPLPVPVLDDPLYPPVEGHAALALPRISSAAPTEILTPLYLRRPDAVPASERKTVSQ